MKKLMFFIFLCSLFPSVANAQETVDATIEWSHRVDLTIAVNGVVESVHVNTGQKVKKGSLLVKLDSRVLEARFTEEKAKVKSLMATYAEVLKELERAEELYERTVLSEHDLQVAKNNKIVAFAALQTAKANRVKAMVDLEHASLLAPFDSIILNRNVEVGQVVINNLNYDKLITLAASDKFLAKASLSVEQALSIRIGQQVTLNVFDMPYQATIIAIKQSKNNISTKSIMVVEFTSQDKKLHVGLVAKIVF